MGGFLGSFEEESGGAFSKETVSELPEDSEEFGAQA
jgi:hypothetical protein